MDWQNEVSGQQRTALVEDDPFAEYRMGAPRVEPARIAEAPVAISQPHDPFAEFRFGSSQIMPTVLAAAVMVSQWSSLLNTRFEILLLQAPRHHTDI